MNQSEPALLPVCSSQVLLSYLVPALSFNVLGLWKFLPLFFLKSCCACKETPDSVTCKEQMAINLFLNNVGIELFS